MRCFAIACSAGAEEENAAKVRSPSVCASLTSPDPCLPRLLRAADPRCCCCCLACGAAPPQLPARV
eukprot:292402-Pleurochrysis_carterae.AAC.1